MVFRNWKWLKMELYALNYDIYNNLIKPIEYTLIIKMLTFKELEQLLQPI